MNRPDIRNMFPFSHHTFTPSMMAAMEECYTQGGIDALDRRAALANNIDTDGKGKMSRVDAIALANTFRGIPIAAGTFCWAIEAIIEAYMRGRRYECLHPSPTVEDKAATFEQLRADNGRTQGPSAAANFQQRQESYFKAIAPWQKIKKDIYTYAQPHGIAEADAAGNIDLSRVEWKDGLSPAQRSMLARCDEMIALIFNQHFNEMVKP